jgi:GNAT superfamily N-acetyltransferase
MSTQAIIFQTGLPPHEFFPKAWASEPLTGVLKETNIPFALPMPDEDVSLVAQEGDQVIGQCSSNRVVKYWSHLEKVDASDQDLSTRVFIAIHKKAVKDEQTYLEQIGESSETAFHSAGIAVLPEYRGRQLGLQMRERQISLCKDNKMKSLFCETTNRYSAATVESFGFTKIAQYPYETLAKELEHPDLSTLDDCFTVWCLRA